MTKMKLIRRLVAVIAIAICLLTALASSASAGEMCIGVRLLDPLDSVRICRHTN